MESVLSWFVEEPEMEKLYTVLTAMNQQVGHAMQEDLAGHDRPVADVEVPIVINFKAERHAAWYHA